MDTSLQTDKLVFFFLIDLDNLPLLYSCLGNRMDGGAW